METFASIFLAAPLAEAPWHAPIGLYFVLVGIASGVSLFGAADAWHGRDEAAVDELAWRTSWVVMIALTIAGALLTVDLGRPERFFLMLTQLNLASPMSVGAKLIALKMALVAFFLYLLFLRRKARAAGNDTLEPGLTERIYTLVPWTIGLVSFALAIYPAVLLGRTWVAPLASTPMAAVIFLVTSLLMGAAVSVLAAGNVGDDGYGARLARPIPGLVVLNAIALGADGLSLAQGASAASVAHAALTGSALFWGLVVVVGLALPFVASSARPNVRLVGVASSVAALCGVGTLRYLMFAIH